jgi:hypothetical protein
MHIFTCYTCNINIKSNIFMAYDKSFCCSHCRNNFILLKASINNNKLRNHKSMTNISNTTSKKLHDFEIYNKNIADNYKKSTSDYFKNRLCSDLYNDYMGIYNYFINIFNID